LGLYHNQFVLSTMSQETSSSEEVVIRGRQHWKGRMVIEDDTEDEEDSSCGQEGT
jgi:hypothetical protein